MKEQLLKQYSWKEKRYLLLFSVLLFVSMVANAQNYTSYFTGNTIDTITISQGGTCLMGGASEDENAIKWFLEQSGGGDILVLRASGSDGYNDYFYTDIGINVNSVETIVFNDATAAEETYIHQKINQAEAIWFAGGDQWKYVSYWRDTPIQHLINQAIAQRNVVVGGTSAGMAILGGTYFSAQNGTVTSTEALANPYDEDVQVDSTDFLMAPYLENVITDTHYDDPDRRGRHTVFMARAWQDWQKELRGIACDEYTAVCIDTEGIAKVYGGYPAYEDNAYFIKSNCFVNNPTPEQCTANIPLEWNKDNQALMVCNIKGTSNGARTFDLNDWQTNQGGEWEYWWVENGEFSTVATVEPDCNMTVNTIEHTWPELCIISPNPATEYITIKTDEDIEAVKILSLTGQEIRHLKSIDEQYIINDMEVGLYFIHVHYQNGNTTIQKIIIQ